jgi:DNA mismatch repair ATPase MutS
LDSIDPNQPILCILDEIFRGTNTAERISAAMVVLNYMVERNSCVIAATHDLELTNLVSNKYNNYHFKEDIEENDIKFDYKLRDGACTSRNAIAILKHLNYPTEIYENAQMYAKQYLNDN